MCATTTEADTASTLLSLFLPKTGAPRLRRRALVPLAATAALLAGCGGGGGVGVGVGFGFGPDDYPPVAALSVAPTQAFPGQAVTLLADARDDYRIAYVAFYLLQPDGSALRLDPLVGGPPYSLSVVLPASPTGVVQFFARAVDDVGQVGDSNVAVVQLLR